MADSNDSKQNSSKYLLNSLDECVHDHLTGLALTNPMIQLVDGVNAVVRKDVDILRQKKMVFIISGGGAGHEPMFAGFVGSKMLTAAVSGAIFTSPSAGAIMKLVEQIADQDTQILFVPANYTGDRLTFGLAKEYLALKGYNRIGWLVFGDDLSPFITNVPEDGIQIKRRGLAGISFIHKIAGVLSERGKSLREIESYLNQVSKLIFTFSVSLSAADIPGHGASFNLGSDEMELGLGVHGESGIQRTKMTTCKQTVSLILKEFLLHLNKVKLLERYKNRIVLLVNNLGGLVTMEMNIVLKEVVEQLSQEKIKIERIYWGRVFTSFDMKGVSFSVLMADSSIVEILDECDQTQSFLNQVNLDFKFRPKLKPKEGSNLDDQRKLFDICPPGLYVKVWNNVCYSLIKNQTILNELDGTVGDSDCGSTFSSMAKFLLNEIDSNPNYPPPLATLAKIVFNQIGGTSGGIYSILLISAHQFIQTNAYPNEYKDAITFWIRLIQHCSDKIQTYGGARLNDRSMIDALHGTILGLQQCANSTKTLLFPELAKIVGQTTWDQAKKTANMKANVGRAAYVDPKLIHQPDAGAYAVAIWIQAILDSLATTKR